MLAYINLIIKMDMETGEVQNLINDLTLNSLRARSILSEKKEKNFVGWNTNLAYVGGRPYTPIDIASSMMMEETILNEPLAYSLREDNLLFLDVTLTYKINKKVKQVFGLYKSKTFFKW